MGKRERKSTLFFSLTLFKSPQGISALLLVGDLKKPFDHSLDSGFNPGSRPPWRSLCLVRRTLSTLLRFLLDHQAALNGISATSLSQTHTIFRPGRLPHPKIERLSWKLRSLYISFIVNKFLERFSV
ncbi:hypothetical protein ILYODFUR_012814 [Ilyodon furcidens]|uniref:Uncharacterized protein n=1 Tax=Ilyodon furcidens TaxID=33524 RepID=A0ABV0SWI2_9TELE